MQGLRLKGAQGFVPRKPCIFIFSLYHPTEPATIVATPYSGGRISLSTPPHHMGTMPSAHSAPAGGIHRPFPHMLFLPKSFTLPRMTGKRREV